MWFDSNMLRLYKSIVFPIQAHCASTLTSVTQICPCVFLPIVSFHLYSVRPVFSSAPLPPYHGCPSVSSVVAPVRFPLMIVAGRTVVGDISTLNLSHSLNGCGIIHTWHLSEHASSRDAERIIVIACLNTFPIVYMVAINIKIDIAI